MRYKVIPQIGKEDCGAACVAMIIENFFSKKVSMFEVRPLIKNTSIGTTFYDLKKGLKRLGINGSIYKAVPQKDIFSEVTYPCITQIVNSEGPHYVVIFQKKGSKLIIGDSNKNKQQVISMNSFINSWIPYILEIDIEHSSLVYEIEQRGKELNLLNILKLVKWNLIISFILSIIIFTLGVVLACMFSLYFNFLIPQKLGSLALELMMLYLVINIMNFLLSFSNSYIYNIMSKKIDKNIIRKYFVGLLEKPNMALESYDMGEMLTNLSNVIVIRERFLTYLQMLPIGLLTMVCSFYFLFTLESNLASLVFILIIILGLVLYLSQGFYEKLSKSLIKTSEKFYKTVINIFENTSIIKQLGLEKEFGNRGIDNLANYISSRTKLANFEAIQNQLKTFVLSSFNIILFSFGVYLIINNKLSSGILLTFNALLSYVTNPIINFTNLQASLVQGKVAQDKLYNILESKINIFGKEKLKDSNNEITVNFQNVSFTYDSNSKIFKNLSMCIKGNNIAITGKNGVGKSTFGKLVARLYIPDAGSIEVSGQNLMTVSDESIINNIIYVDGRESLFNTSALDNIKLGRELKDENIFETLDNLNATSAFPNLDFKNITNKQLSLGQMQVIKILRATLVKKRIYIFDEITNGLDEVIKSSVIDYLLNLEGLKFFITHDKEVAERCEKEYIIKNNDIIRKN